MHLIDIPEGGGKRENGEDTILEEIMTEFSRSDESPLPLELRNPVNLMQNKSKKQKQNKTTQRHSENAENKR